jgi:hypothetical protein
MGAIICSGRLWNRRDMLSSCHMATPTVSIKMSHYIISKIYKGALDRRRIGSQCDVAQ